MKLSEVSISLRRREKNLKLNLVLVVVLVLESKPEYSGNKIDKRAMYNAQIKILSLKL